MPPAATTSGEIQPLALLVEAFLRGTFAAASYVETSMVFGPGQTRVRVDRVWQRPPGYLRVERQAGGLDGGLVLIVNPGRAWLESPGFPWVLETTPQEAMAVADYQGFRLLRWLLAHADDLAFGQPAEVLVGGRRAYQLMVTVPKAGSARLVIDQESGLVIREERFGPSRRPLETVTRSELDFASPLDDKLFRPSVRPAGRVMRDPPVWHHAFVRARLAARLPYPALVPPRPPGGYRLEAAELLERNGELILALRYGNGREVVSVFEARAREGAGGSDDPRRPEVLPSRGGVRAFRLVVDDISLTLVGRLDLAEAEAIFRTFLASRGER